jgi:hypothetical protein
MMSKMNMRYKISILRKIITNGFGEWPNLGTPSVCLAVFKSRPDGRRSRHFNAPVPHFSLGKNLVFGSGYAELGDGA